MEKRLHRINYTGAEQLFVDGELWADHGLTLQQLAILKCISEHHGGVEFIFTDQPIPESVWTDRRNLLFWKVGENFVRKMLYTHKWRGGCHDPMNVLKVSSRFGTEMSYVQTWPKDLGENSVVVWWRNPGLDATPYIVFEYQRK